MRITIANDDAIAVRQALDNANLSVQVQFLQGGPRKNQRSVYLTFTRDGTEHHFTASANDFIAAIQLAKDVDDLIERLIDAPGIEHITRKRGNGVRNRNSSTCDGLEHSSDFL